MSNQKQLRRSSEEWHILMESYENSKLTQQEFCELHKMSKSHFHKKHKEYREFQCSDRQMPGRDFVPLEVLSDITEPELIKFTNELQLEGECGIKVKFIKGCSPKELHEAMRILRNVG